MGFAILGAAVALVIMLDKKAKGKVPSWGADVLAVVMVALALIAGVGFAMTFLGDLYVWIVGALSSIPGIGPAVRWVVIVVLAVTLFIDVCADREADRAAQIAALLILPTADFFAGGKIGEFGNQVSSVLFDAAVGFMTSMGG